MRMFWMVAMMAALSTSAQAFDLQGHRGARGLAPENTLPAFALALSIGVTTLELDVAMTKDGILVGHHDEWLNSDIARGPDGRFLGTRGPAIHSLTLDEVKRYDVGRIKPRTGYAAEFPEQRPIDGTRIPTLEEVFTLVQRANADHIRFNIETKITPTSGADAPAPDVFAAAVARAITGAGLTRRASVQSFDWRTLVVLQRIAPEIERVCLTDEQPGGDTIERGKPGPSPWTAGLDVDDFGGSTPRLVAAAGCPAWSPNFADLTPDKVAEARSLGIKVIPWTVNARADMERVIDLGVDGIISDYPDRLRAVLTAKGIPVPPPVAVP
ncbi:MAG: glycerophosphodiester phosphodiesterase [Xanthobacteraceae bacterium]